MVQQECLEILSALFDVDTCCFLSNKTKRFFFIFVCIFMRNLFSLIYKKENTFDGWSGNIGNTIISVTIEIIHTVCIQVSYRQTYKNFKSLL